MLGSLKQQFVLILIVVGLIGNETSAACVPGFPLAAEFSSPRPTVRVPIINAAKDINIIPSSFAGLSQGGNSCQTVLRNFALAPLEKIPSDTYSDRSIGKHIGVVTILVKEVIGQPFVWRHACIIGEDGNVSRGRFAKIFHRDNEKITEPKPGRKRNWGRSIATIVRSRDVEGNLFYSHIGSESAPFRVLHGFDGLSESVGLKTEDHELKKSDSREDSGQLNKMPIVRRLLLAVIGLCGGFLVSVAGWKYLDDERGIFGASLICGGWFFGGLGLGLLWLTNFDSTWGWWL